MTDVLPTSLQRRLLLSLLGFRWRAGAWCGPHGPLLTEEQVDRMTAAQWTRYLRRWRASASAMN
jgi:hypothetical protein